MIESRAYAKVNIFLKIAGKKGNYHNLVSRFVRVHSLYDVIRFEKGVFDEFVLDGEFGCDIKQNTIYKAYIELSKISSNVKDIFKEYKVIVKKNIPEFAGLGGGSSDAATFMIMVNQYADLKLSKDQLAKIGVKIGADIPFFIYEYDSANVRGIGDIVEKFNEPILNIKTFTPKIKCNTGAIFKEFRKSYYKEISIDEEKSILSKSSIEVLNSMDIKEANDLYEPASFVYPELIPKNYNLDEKTTFFSGSGSSFFYLVD
ncbi:MAG: 4-(cytidine 5'-diphospho)-2-C-methyl-D-erythritol kinase [Campylobacterota bacterium]|nr:4-(cytidine 5'-diphospho)-2-C-methyl-D-erythritol kinase [Campylobacterota bacterium]